MKKKIIYLLFILIFFPGLIYSDIVYFYEGFNKLKEFNCKIISIDSTYLIANYTFRNMEENIKIHISRIYYLKFNERYLPSEQFSAEAEWEEQYNVKSDQSNKRIYLRNVSDSIRNLYSNIKFMGKDANILMGDILQYHPADSSIKLYVTKKTGTDTLIKNWEFVQYISIWYRQ